MRTKVWCQTDKGLKRDSNQDSYLADEKLGLYIVADGMGGHSGGEVASQMAVLTAQYTFQEAALSQKKDIKKLVQKSYIDASAAIFDKTVTDNPELKGMGTTMVMAYCTSTQIIIGNVGDSRAYLFRKPYLWQLTEDHSLLNEHIRAGIDPNSVPIGRNVITRSVGFERDVQADVIERALIPGDRYLLCSDGLSSLVTDPKISEILNKATDDQVVEDCIKQALQAGGLDNVTVLYLAIEA